MNETTLSALVVLQLLIIGGFEVFDHLRDRPAPPFYSIEVSEVEVVRLLEQNKEVVLRRISDGAGGSNDRSAGDGDGASNDRSDGAGAGNGNGAGNGDSAPLATSEWVLEGGLPADSDKVNRLLNDLASAGNANWPVATTLISSKRFEVADDFYKKRLVLERVGGEPELDLYLGSAPTFGQTHARISGGLGIYSLRFAEYEANSDAKEWLSKTLLGAVGELGLVQRLDAGVDGWTMQRGADGWQSDDVEDLQADAAVNLTGRLKNLRVLSAADISIKVDDAQLLLHFMLKDAEGSYELMFFDQGDEMLVVKSSRLPQYFEVANHLRDVLDVNKTKLSTP